MTDGKGPSSGSLEREWIKSLKEFSGSMRTRVVSPWHGPWTEKRLLLIKWVPPTSAQSCDFQRLFSSHWARYFCASSDPGLHGFKCVSLGARWYWTPTGQQWEPRSHQWSPQTCVGLWALETTGGTLRGSQKRSKPLGQLWLLRNELDHQEV